MLSIVMYHYVRDLTRSRFPGIKGLDLALFREQLAYITRHYTPVTMAQVIAAYEQGDSLPDHAILLTFDDGYADHYQNVFPLLHDLGVSGCFYPPAQPILEGRVLDVNKVHYILAAVTDAGPIVRSILDLVDAHRTEFALESNEAYLARYAAASRFDPAEVIFIKRMLQVGLPAELRGRITDELFQRHVTRDERAFSAELYMSWKQLRGMVQAGMHVGCHSYSHRWLDSLAPAEQEREIELSLQFLADIGADTGAWTISYPYGGWNASLLRIVRQRGCRAGLTTEVRVASSADDALLLPRLDTNDLPKDRNAAPPALPRVA